MSFTILILGLLIGSFLNVCIYRIPRKESIAWPGSHCPGCGYVLKWYDLLPILSYLFLRGKCRQCRSNIALRYPLVELITGLLFLAAYSNYGLGWILLSKCVFICLMLVIGLTDLEHYIIPNIIVFPGIVVGLLIAILPGPLTLTNALASGIGAGLFFFIIWFFYPKGMGEGDVKLALMLGTFLGWPNIALAIFLSSLLGSVGGVITVAIKHGDRKTPIPFGLYLALGSLITAFYGQQLLQLYLNLIGWQ
jgi:leader peptidase (prepilin peptidase) / N-methyltransferase